MLKKKNGHLFKSLIHDIQDLSSADFAFSMLLNK